MKIRYLILFAFIHNISFTQEKRSVVIKTNSLIYLVKTGFNVTIETQTKEKRSLNFSFESGDRKINYVPTTPEKDKFIVLSAEKRKYSWVSKNAPSGFFRGPYLKYRYKDKIQEGVGSFYANNTGTFKAHFVSLGYVVGFQNLIANRISIEPKLGLGIQARLFIKGTTNLTPILPDGLLGFSIGIRI